MSDVSLEDLAAMWHDRDPVPPDLADRVLVGLAMERLDEEYELLHLVERSHQLAGTRQDTASPLSISFVGDDLSLLLRVSQVGDQRRVDGWLAPAQEARVAVRGVDREWHADVDAHGRFEIDRLSAGLARIVVATAPGDEPPPRGHDVPAGDRALFVTPVVEL